MNELIKPANTQLSGLASLKKNLQQVRATLPVSGNSQYLRMLTDGDWVFGAEDNAVAAGTEAVINPASIEQGYSCWSNHPKGGPKNELLGEQMYPLGAPVPSKHEMPDKGWPWGDQSSFDVKFLNGKHENTQVLYKTSSRGGINMVRTLIDAILARLEEDTVYLCPIITFGNDHYKHKSYGKTYVPVMSIVSWMDMDGNEDPALVDGAEPAEIEAPKEEPKAEPEQEPAPVGRRRAPVEETPAAAEKAPATEGEPVRRRRT